MESEGITWCINMFNIDDEDLEEESLEDQVFEKADYIGEVLTGERKIQFKLPERAPKVKVKSIKRPSTIKTMINNFKKSFKKYKEMSLSRLIGITILILITISIFAFVIYLLLLLLAGLLKLGIFGFIIFLVAMCAILVCGVLLLTARYNRK
jgi:hypothetical protein